MRSGIAGWLALATLSWTAASCDRTPAELEALIQEQGLRQLELSAAAASPGSAERQVLDVAARLGAGPTEPAPQIPVLDQLFQLATERIAARRGEAIAAGVMAEQLALENAAWQSIERGDQDGGERELAAARTSRAHLTVRELGNAFAVAYVAVVGLAVERAQSEVAPRAGQRADGRLRRMAASARNLHSDAADGLLDGDPVRALDVASHAAGLLNTFFAELERRR